MPNSSICSSSAVWRCSAVRSPAPDARRLVAQHDPGEGANAAAARVERRQPADQVEEKVLPQVIEIGARQAQAAPQARGGSVRLVEKRDEVGSGDRGMHGSVPRSSVSMNRDCRRSSRLRWELRGTCVGVPWETRSHR
jgi:hypothetical protein